MSWRTVVIALILIGGGALAAWFSHLFRSQYPYRTVALRRAAFTVAGVSLVATLLMLGALVILVPALLR